jgi:hypothetical protein
MQSTLVGRYVAEIKELRNIETQLEKADRKCRKLVEKTEEKSGVLDKVKEI